MNTYPHTERKMHARGRARIQKGDDSWCAMSSFCIGGEFVYTELWGRSSANEPVLYMIRHNGASVCVRCLGHDFDECALQAMWTCGSDPRRAGKHKLQWMCDGSERNSTTRIPNTSCTPERPLRTYVPTSAMPLCNLIWKLALRSASFAPGCHGRPAST